AKVFKALCDANRLQIIDILRGGEECACKLLDALNIGQSTLSHHMKILCESGIVAGRRNGKWMFYSIDPKETKKAKKLLLELTKIKTSQKKYSGCN
ncbi:MAG: metalloregulator ArsR/SmtB family transcription factor, partial [Elusimicrobium sp.]|nr:metalloregulator ArsR/SmtB family transcription factor [Elusimicrobium sp.]